MSSRVPPWIGAVAIDAAAVLTFAAAGRQSHDDGSSAGAILGIAAPFLVGLAIGYVATPGARRAPLAWPSAVGVSASTVVLGLVLRRTAWDRGTALSFIIVTAVVLAVLLLGWRGLWALGGRRRTVRSGPPPSRADR